MTPHSFHVNRARFVAAALAVLVLITGVVSLGYATLPQPAAPAATPPVRAVSHIGLVVADLDRSVDFYTRILTFTKLTEVELAGSTIEHLTGVFGVRCRTARLQLGTEEIELTQYLAPEGQPIPADSRSHDRWFQHIAIVVSDMDRAYQHLRSHKVRHASSGPQTLPEWNPTAGGISAFYFKDPDGHALEIIRFPSGKGDPRWQAPTDQLFLGIDHTAIVVADTDHSIAFYQGVLGMRLAGESENYGIEQERLNNVFGARLRITALRAPAGPGVELLQYLAPSDGRDIPLDSRSNDLLSWTTHVTTNNAASLSARMRHAKVRWVSPGFIGGTPTDSGFAAAATIRDPDGHLVVITQPH